MALDISQFTEGFDDTPAPPATYNPGALVDLAPNVPELRAVQLRSSILVPMIVTLLLGVTLAAGIVVSLRGDNGQVVVPGGVVEQQAEVANTGAESVRRSLNGAVDDLRAFAAVQATSASPVDSFEESAAAFLEVHDRYRSVTLTEDTEIERSRIDVDVVRDTEGNGSLVMWAPMRTDRSTSTVVGYFDVDNLDFSLSSLGTSRGWVVDSDGEIIASTIEGSSGALPSSELRRAAQLALDGPGAFVTAGSPEFAEIIAYASVIGDGPGGQVGLVVVTSRPVATMRLASVDLRFTAWSLAGATVVLVLGSLVWIYVKIVGPMRNLRRDAHTIACGELRLPVSITGNDEIGGAARSLEQIRVSIKRMIR
jgi:HAMP domain-containing protein